MTLYYSNNSCVLDEVNTMNDRISYLQCEPEGQLLDRKRASIHPKDVAQHISAFANAEGGTLVIGIEDDGKITGFSQPKAKKIDIYVEAPFEYLSRLPKYTKETVKVKNNNGMTITF